MSLHDSALTALKVCMALKPGEKLLIITDKNKRRIADALLKAGRELGAAAELIEIPVGTEHGAEPSEKVSKIMQSYDVIMMPTTISLSHTEARRKATAAGARIASMPDITEEIMERTMSADYKKVRKLSTRLADILTKGKIVKISTDKGTSITMDIGGIAAEGHSGGIFDRKGNWGNLPDGEASLMPNPGTTNGLLVVDASMAGIGKVDGLRITIKEGFATKIEGDKAGKLLKLLNRFGKDARNIAELGIGTNEKAKITGIVLEDEKVLGTAHIALGNNMSYGGKVGVNLHLDGVFRNPTISVDGKLIMEKGKLRI